jgi:hypothetical protein
MKYNLLHKIWLICQCPIIFFCEWEGKILLKIEKTKNQPLDCKFRFLRQERIISCDSYGDVSWQGKKVKRSVEVTVYEGYEAMLDFVPQPNYYPQKYTTEQIERQKLDAYRKQCEILRQNQLNYLFLQKSDEDTLDRMEIKNNIAFRHSVYEQFVWTHESLKAQNMLPPEISNPFYERLLENPDEFIKYFFPNIKNG